MSHFLGFEREMRQMRHYLSVSFFSNNSKRPISGVLNFFQLTTLVMDLKKMGKEEFMSFILVS
jgi:hypothetical protein